MIKYILIFCGTCALVLGIIGIFLPLLPTTPFLLLAATCYVHSSKKMYDKLLTNRYLGNYIRNYREYKAIPLRAKIISVSLVWTTLLYCIFFTTELLWLRIFFLLLAVGISWHILSYKTLKRK